MLLGASAMSLLAAMAQRVGVGPKPVEHGAGRCRCHTAWQVTPEERAARRAAKAAKRAAHEERKRLRREAAAEVGTAWGLMTMVNSRDRMVEAAAVVRRLRTHWESADALHEARRTVRLAELRYAIACAAAGAVPGERRDAKERMLH